MKRREFITLFDARLIIQGDGLFCVIESEL